jgi:hypothetical protein
MNIPPAAPHQKIKFAIEQLMENMPILVELMEYQAKIARVKYDAFITAGFTPEQALYLAKEEGKK